jgi:cytochrome c oxidase assembly protein subunit 11
MNNAMPSPQKDEEQQNLARKNKKLALSVLFTVVIMVGMAYASVPLYSLFCRVTGFGGTPQFAESAPDVALIRERKIRVNFTTNINQNLFWDFKPGDRSITINVGEQGLTNFVATSQDGAPSAGTALYNVTPLKAGKYFHKIECFCFGEQILVPGQTVQMPVLFYIDPAFDDDPNIEDIDLLTLSYTFYRTETDALDEAMEEFYEAE